MWQKQQQRKSTISRIFGAKSQVEPIYRRMNETATPAWPHVATFLFVSQNANDYFYELLIRGSVLSMTRYIARGSDSTVQEEADTLWT